MTYTRRSNSISTATPSAAGVLSSAGAQVARPPAVAVRPANSIPSASRTDVAARPAARVVAAPTPVASARTSARVADGSPVSAPTAAGSARGRAGWSKGGWSKSRESSSDKKVAGQMVSDHGKPPVEHEILFQSFFKSVGPRTYAAQVKKAGNGNHYLVLTEGKRDEKTGEVKKIRLFLYSEDFVAFFGLLKQTAEFIKAHPVPDKIRQRQSARWAKAKVAPVAGGQSGGAQAGASSWH